MQEHPGLFTNQQWLEGQGELFSSYNPADGKMVWQGREATAMQIDQAIRQARQAFDSWANLLIDERSQYLDRFGNILRKNSLELAEIISQEVGKPLWDSKNEVSSMLNKIGISLEAYGSRCAGMIREQTQAHSITRHRPHGVVAVFGPYNFPGHLPNGHIVPALLAGNTIIFKPSELAPLVAETITRYWQEASLPPGVFNLAQGGAKTGQALASHPDIQGLFFTGSYRTGLALSKLFGAHPEKILALEMGGNNPLIIGRITQLEPAAYLAIQSAYLSSGQRCTCARRLIVIEEKNSDAFIHCLKEMTEKIVVGKYNDEPEPFMGPVVSFRQASDLLEAQSQLISRGGIPLLKMENLIPHTGFLSPGLLDVTGIADRPDEEYFGPLLQIIRVKDLDEAIKEANQTKYGLAAGLFSEDSAEYQNFYRSIRAGIVNWNTQLTGASSTAPFGGIGCSGNHRPSAYYAADYCSYPVASLENAQLRIPSTLSPGISLNNQ